MYRVSNTLDFLIDFLMSFLALYAMVPIVAFTIPSFVRVIAMFILVMAIYGRTIDVRVYFKIWRVFLISLLTLLTTILIEPAKGPSYLYYVINLYTLGILYFYCKLDKLNNKILKISKFVIFILIINAITTINGNIIFPHASRQLASMKYVEGIYDTYMLYNIGGFDVVYTFVLVSPVFLYGLRFSKSYGKKLFNIICLFIMGYSILLSNYTLAILLYGFSFIFLLLLPKHATSKQMMHRMFIVLFLFVILNEYLSDLLSSIASMVSEKDVSERIGDLAQFFKSGQIAEDTDMAMRADHYSVSFKMISENFIFGTWLTSGHSGGGHSFFLDIISTYGIIGIICLYIFFKTIFRFYFRIFRNTKIYTYVMFIYIIYIILSFLNPQPFILTMTFVLPFLFDLYSHKSVKKQIS